MNRVHSREGVPTPPFDPGLESNCNPALPAVFDRLGAVFDCFAAVFDRFVAVFHRLGAVFDGKRRRNEAFEFDSNCQAPQRAWQFESNSNAKV